MSKKKVENTKVETPTPEVTEQVLSSHAVNPQASNTEDKSTVEEAQIKFTDKSGNTITFEISINSATQALEMHADFGGKPAAEHKGFYTHLAHKFFQDVQNSGTPVEEAK